jgi:hypothetical protein
MAKTDRKILIYDAPVKTAWLAALPIFEETICRHSPTVSVALIPFADNVARETFGIAADITWLLSACANCAPFAGPKL